MSIDKGKSQLAADELRRRAEEKLMKKRATAPSLGTTEDPWRLLHELQVHQIELEMQNAELDHARVEVEAVLEKYTDLYDFAPVGYFTLGHDGAISTVNLRGASILGIERARLIGQRFGFFVAEKARLVFADFLNKVFMSQAKEACEVALLKEGNPVLIVQIEGVSVAPGDSCRIALIDITERKRSEERLRAAHGRVEAILEQMSDGFASFDRDWRYTYVNTAAAKVFATAPEQLLGKTIWEMWPAAYDLPIGVNFRRSLQENIPIQFECYYPAPLERWFECRCYPTTDGLATFFSDITGRKNSEEALEKWNKELESQVAERTAEIRNKDQILLLQNRQAAMGEMIGNIAHQWRQPLNLLGLTVQQFLMYYDLGGFDRTFLTENVGKSMELIHHMSETIDDFRNYFNPDKEKVEFKVQKVLVKTLSIVDGSLQNPRISVEIVAKDDPVIYGYPNEFAQVLLNIVINARDALIEREIHDPKVTITIYQEDGCAIVTVADNGGGISEEIMDKVFDPYFTTKGPQRGTGIGLFMSKSIVENNMGGRLTVSNIANGAEFRIEVCNGIDS